VDGVEAEDMAVADVGSRKATERNRMDSIFTFEEVEGRKERMCRVSCFFSGYKKESKDLG
jgi:hypothetical protein